MQNTAWNVLKKGRISGIGENHGRRSNAER